MKLLICIVQDADVSPLMDDMVEKGFRVTKLASSGGFLRSGNTTLFTGVKDEEVKDVLAIIEKNCKKRNTVTTMVNPNLDGSVFQTFPVEIEVGGATVFQLNLEEMFQL